MTEHASELERAVREAWPGCEYERTEARGRAFVHYYRDEHNRLRIEIFQYPDRVECYVEPMSDDIGYGDASAPDAAIAAARKQARERLAEWMEVV